MRVEYRLEGDYGGVPFKTDKPQTYFSDARGELLGPDELYFDTHPGAPLPDLVRRLAPRLYLRTSFKQDGQKIAYETVSPPEPPCPA